MSRAQNKEFDRLKQQISDLSAQNKHLHDLLSVAQAGGLSMRGYLYKYKPFNMSLFANEWEQRYFTLCGSVLTYYKTEHDLAFAPRGQVDVKGCVVEWEGVKRTRHHTFGIVDPMGTSLIRISASTHEVAEQWMQALEAAGCLRRTLSTLARQRSPLRGADIRWRPNRQRRNSGSESDVSLRSYPHMQPSSKMQNRWEESDTDSDVHETTRATRARLPLIPPIPSSPAPSEALSEASTAQLDPSPAPRSSAHHSKPHQPPQRAPMSGSTPVHTSSRFSYLSSDGVWAAKHEGLFNLGMVILLAANCRLILENLMKYGLRLHMLRFFQQSLSGDSGAGNLAVSLCFPALFLFPFTAWVIESLAARNAQNQCSRRDAMIKREHDPKAVARWSAATSRNTERIMLACNLVNTTMALALPCLVLSYTDADPLPGFALTLPAFVLWMKLVSYAHCCWDLRCARRAGEARSGERGAPDADPDWAVLQYPENLTLGNMLYFLAAPTLTYQVNFPRSHRLRKRWLARRCLELLAFLGVLLFIVDQYILPSLDNALAPMTQLNWLHMTERVLKLAIPNMYAWLCMFYCLFHLWLNILAEVLRFGDREFYKDWWNASTIGDYWRLWNMPVHKWLLRTVYFPALRAGVPRFWSMMLVFFVSAVGHELCLGVPLHLVRFWAFAGIMAQVPLVLLTEYLKKRLKSDTWGNYLFWITFCMVGQPVSVLTYYHDWVVLHRGA